MYKRHSCFSNTWLLGGGGTSKRTLEHAENDNALFGIISTLFFILLRHRYSTKRCARKSIWPARPVLERAGNNKDVCDDVFCNTVHELSFYYQIGINVHAIENRRLGQTKQATQTRSFQSPACTAHWVESSCSESSRYMDWLGFTKLMLSGNPPLLTKYPPSSTIVLANCEGSKSLSRTKIAQSGRQRALQCRAHNSK